MSPLEYFRPQTLKEAIELLKRGVPLAGGSALTPKRHELETVIDIQDLGLDGISSEAGSLIIGSAARLQQIVEASDMVPETLRTGCRLEAGLNIRNMATLGGTIMTSDGRSPLLTVLLALDTKVVLEPGSEKLNLTELLETRENDSFRRLITYVHISLPIKLEYEQVSRSPVDRPLICASVAKLEGEPGVRVVLGGYGQRPLLLSVDEKDWDLEGVDVYGKAARAAFSSAGDDWASAEYRSEVADVLVRRLVEKVSG
jgi:CO/xanthine dehydrogenase FAD-binding subunit